VHPSDADVVEVEITTTTDGVDIGKGQENTVGVGTSSYASPEQIKGSDYDSSSDVYSLGIILFELCYPMHTGMERCAVFDGIRQKVPVFPDAWHSSMARKLPTLHSLLVSMLSHDPKQRPTASEVASCVEALLSEYTVQSLGGSFQSSEGVRILRVEAEDKNQSVLERTIQIIQDASPKVHIHEYGLRSKGSKTIMEFAITLLSDYNGDPNDAKNVINEAVEDILCKLKSVDEIKVVRLING
jgi:serine/threonine protein kinase